MGKRLLRVSSDLLVEFLKEHDGLGRMYTVERGLPDDAHIVDEAPNFAWRSMDVVLESASWADDQVASAMDPPVVHVEFVAP